jgi:CDP-2,3-bis-(O-geranylgeranyl)-sn-glycerol synthase
MPILAKNMLRDRFSGPLDRGLKLRDGYPLFGKSKTLRGLVSSVACTSIAAPLLGLAWPIGAMLAAASMTGDLLSSFIKRRLGLQPHAQASGLDQIPEALLPLLLVRHPLYLTAADVALLVAAFIVAEVGLSRVLFRLHFRDRPY